MKIIVCGAGEVGKAIIAGLWETNDIVLIDQNPELVENLYSTYDIQAIVGSATSLNILSEADIQKGDVFLAVTNSDEVNIISSIMAKNLGAGYVFGRIRNPEYLEDVNFMHEAIGITQIVNPELDAAHVIKEIISFPEATDIETFSEGNNQIVGLKVDKDGLLDGKILKEFGQKYGKKLLICAVKRNEEVIIPNGSFRMLAGDNIYVTGTPESIKNLFGDAVMNENSIKNILIIGGGTLTHYLLADLIPLKRYYIKVIEEDYQKAEKLALDYPDIDVIHGDGSDQRLLDLESFENYDAVICTKKIDEENIVISSYAKYKKISKIITKVDQPSLLKPLSYLGLDTIITPKNILADKIIALTRNLKATINSSITSYHSLLDNAVEAIEFEILKESDITKMSLNDLNLLDNTLLIGIQRNGTHIIPTGKDIIQVGDRVTIVTKHQFITDIEDFVV
jgi:trk system potassium uptake protein TrkA